ncbi:MAG: AmmeMemoRadiSam system protein B [Candidatus Omnitrophica bacterium]|nr:AmmeMemoRadiSam system protein B [Candidatus Omnitrophota bacterium]
MSPQTHSNQNIKKPNVSGQFYSADADELSRHIDHFIAKSIVEPLKRPVDIVIAPHAGYVYSGGVAAYGFKAVQEYAYKTIVILAPSHYFGFDGISVWESGGMETPLGIVEVDEAFAKQLTTAHQKIYYKPEYFEQEHSLEVEIPFLQKSFQDFKIVPVVMGQPTPELLKTFAQALTQAINGRDDVLIVVSTDLSHYHNDAKARKMDEHAIEAITKFDVERIWNEVHQRTNMEMCGLIPVTTALLYAKMNALNQVDVLRYANSGDVSGDRDRVVGYASILIYKKDQGKSDKMQDELSSAQKSKLLDTAKKTVEEYVRKGKVYEVAETDPRLLKEEGAFVTLHKNNHLRGCIGNIIGQGPLYLTVRNMAVAAASQDPRFDPVQVEELDAIDVEVSVLSKPRRVKSVDEIELGKHGVIISQGSHHGVFLPQVADETGWSKEEFLSQLCSQKARLPRDCWKDPQTVIEVFTAQVF